MIHYRTPPAKFSRKKKKYTITARTREPVHQYTSARRGGENTRTAWLLSCLYSSSLSTTDLSLSLFLSISQ